MLTLRTRLLSKFRFLASRFLETKQNIPQKETSQNVPEKETNKSPEKIISSRKAERVKKIPRVLNDRFKNFESEGDFKYKNAFEAGGVPPVTLAKIEVDLKNFLNPPGYADKFRYDIPFDINGSEKLFKFYPKMLIGNLLMNQKEEDTDFLQIFHSFYDTWIDALLKGDNEKIKKLCEKRLAERTIAALENLKKNNLKVFIIINKLKNS